MILKERSVDSPEAILGEGWTNALATLDNTDAIREISCPEDYQYELDSDFEEVDEDESPPDGSGSERDLAAPEGRSSISSLTARAYFSSPDRPAVGKGHRKVQ